MTTPTDDVLSRLGLTSSGEVIDQRAEVETTEELLVRLRAELEEARATACRLEEELAKRPPL